MKKVINNSPVRFKVYSIIMLLALAWLTVSTPFVNAQQQALKKLEVKAHDKPDAEEGCNPFSNTTEEKTENGASTLSEYLHDNQLTEHHFSVLETYYKCHPADLYFAFHPELISPPPEV